jgi:hypothetical protein
MRWVAFLGQLLRPILNLAPIRQTRRNHALEHATVHVLNRQGYTLSGVSSVGGFELLGDIPTPKVETAVKSALQKLQQGQHHLAVHPNCGTNLLTVGLLTTTIGAVGFVGTNRRSVWERFMLVVPFMMFAVIYSQPLGMALQKHITTEGNPGDLEYVGITRREVSLPVIGKWVVHTVVTRRG